LNLLRIKLRSRSAKKENLIPTIETVIAAVQAGELDTVLATMSKSAVLTKGKKAA
jgi:hypothetical protein